jgi:hypothetical protein
MQDNILDLNVYMWLMVVENVVILNNPVVNYNYYI